MITPTRFGLKYAPIPTLALEYEDDLKTLDDGLSTTSLYVYSGKEQEQQRPMKKLHVVELPALTKHSEPVAVARQLQQDNQRFLAPDVVKEDQLVRLLERLMAHLQATELSVSSPFPAVVGKKDDGETTADAGDSMAGKFGSHAADDDDDEEDDKESELDESALDESIAEVSASMDASKAEDSGEEDGIKASKATAKSEAGANASEPAVTEAAASESAKPAYAPQALKHSHEAHDDKDDDESAPTSPVKPSKTDSEAEEDAREAQEDAAKRRVLKSESEASDDSEEDIQSEELEYFSEDASDEDSF